MDLNFSCSLFIVQEIHISQQGYEVVFPGDSFFWSYEIFFLYLYNKELLWGLLLHKPVDSSARGGNSYLPLSVEDLLCVSSVYTTVTLWRVDFCLIGSTCLSPSIISIQGLLGDRKDGTVATGTCRSWPSE